MSLRTVPTKMEAIFNALGPARAFSPLQILFSLLLSFVMSLLLAAVYQRTHTGYSYSRTFVQTIALAAIVSCIMIIAIGNNLARGLGILGALALIRFRTPIRDPRDIIFLFASLATGIAAGAQVVDIAIIGPVFFCFAVLFLHYSPFASRRSFEGLLRFILLKGESGEALTREVFVRHTSSVNMVAMREAIQGEAVEYSYHVRLLDPSGKPDLIVDLEAIEGIEDVSMVMQRSTVEI